MKFISIVAQSYRCIIWAVHEYEHTEVGPHMINRVLAPVTSTPNTAWDNFSFDSSANNEGFSCASKFPPIEKLVYKDFGCSYEKK